MIEVVIPVHNRRAITLRCLELLAGQVDAEFRVTVVDDGSSDGTSQAIRERFPHVDLLMGDGSLWWAGATNLGIRHALQRNVVAPYILMLNDDVVFDSDYLASMQRCAAKHPGCLIGTLAVYSEDPNRVFWCGEAASRRKCLYGYVRRDSLSGCVPAEALPGRGMLVPTEVFHRIGLLDEKAFPQYIADFDFSIRARKAGYGLICCCDTTLMAMASQTGLGSVYRKDGIGDFLRSFWHVRSPNYLPAVWRFQRRHYGVVGPLLFIQYIVRVLLGDFLRRTGLRGQVGANESVSNKIRPRSIRLEVSSFCQLRCPSCPTTDKAIHPAVGSGFLKLSDFQKLLDENPWISEVELSNYGEIFLNPELLEILREAHRRNARLRADNGVNLNNVKENVLEGLVKYKFRSMTCSIDGASPETYAIYRVRGKFERVIENIKKINLYKNKHRSKYPALTWQFIVFGHNEHEIAAARKLSSELNMDFRLKLNWDDDFSPVRNKAFLRKEIGIVSRDEYKVTKGYDYAHEICFQLWEEPQINWDGKVLGCGRNFWGDFGGNVFEDGLVDAVNNEKINYARDMLLGKRVERADIPCTTCDIYLTRKEGKNWVKTGWSRLLYRTGRFCYRLFRVRRIQQWVKNTVSP